MKILIVDDHAVVRQGYSSLLANLFPSSEITEACDGKQALAVYQELNPDLVIMDINMEGISGIEAGRLILQRFPDAKILFFSMYRAVAVVRQALEIGASGYITKSCSVEILLEAVNRILAGQTYIEHELAMKFAIKSGEQSDLRLQELTQREFEIFVMLSRGDSINRISEQLCLSGKTISNYSTAVKNKLVISSTAQLVHLAIETGVVKISAESPVSA